MPDMMTDDYANRAAGTASTAGAEQTPDASQVPNSSVNTGALAPNAASAAPNEPQNTGIPANVVQTQQQQKPQGNEPHNVFRSIFDALAGPSVRYNIDDHGNMVETPVKRTKTQLADSIVAGALTGLFSGLGEHGPNSEARAASKGFGAVQEQQQLKQNEGKGQAVADYSRRMSTLEANLRLRQNAMQLYTLGSKAMEPYINDGKALVEKLGEQPGALLDGGREYSASEIPELMNKYHVTNEALIPVGQGPVIGPDGKPEIDADGQIKSQFKYVAVNPNFDVAIPDDLLQKFRKYNVPGFVGADGKPIELPKDAKAKALFLINGVHQLGAIEAFENTVKKYTTPNTDTEKVKPNPQGVTKLPNISSTGTPDPKITKLVDNFAKTNGIEKGLARAIVQAESGGNPKAVSKAGAKGVMQIMPENYNSLGIKDPFDPEQNIRGGLQLFKQLLDRFGSVKLALAAYNSNPKAVVDAGYDVPNFPETQAYVKKIMALAGITDDEEPEKIAKANTPEGK